MKYFRRLVLLAIITVPLISLAEDIYNKTDITNRFGNQIDMVSGMRNSVSWSHTDLIIKVGNDLEFPITRVKSDNNNSTYAYQSSLGNYVGSGWSIDLGGLYSSSSNSINQIRVPGAETDRTGKFDGGVQRWVQTGSWSWKSSDGYTYDFYSGSGDTTLIPDPKQYFKYSVQKITSPSGAFINFNYNRVDGVQYKYQISDSYGTGKVPRLDSITTSDGQIYTFKYNPSHFFLESIEYDNANILYQYVSKTHYLQSSVNKDFKHLNKVIYADGTYWEYGENYVLSPWGEQVTYNPSRNGSARILTQSFKRNDTLTTYNHSQIGEKTRTISVEDNVCRDTVFVGEGAIKSTDNENTQIFNGETHSIEALYHRIKSVITYKTSSCNSALEEIKYDYKIYESLKKANGIDTCTNVSTTSNTDMFCPTHLSNFIISETTKTIYHDNNIKDVYKKELSLIDSAGQPGVITETYSTFTGTVESNKKQKVTRLTYFKPTNLHKLGLVDTMTIDGIAGSIDNDYDSYGNLTQTNRYGVITKFTPYTSGTAKGQVQNSTNANNHVFNYSNYKKGIAQTETGPNGLSITRVVDNEGRLTSQTSNGVTTTYGYDVMGRVTSVVSSNPNDYNTSITYVKNGEGLLQTITRGTEKTYNQYYSNGWLKSVETVVVNATGGSRSSKVTYEYDVYGRKTFSSFANSTHGMRTVYDGIGRVKTVTNTADNSVTTYEYGVNNTVVVTDPYGQKIETTRDPFNNEVIKIDVKASTTSHASTASVTTINRNLLGLVETVVQGGLTQRNVYDSKWQLDYQDIPELGRVQYTMDGLNNVVYKQQGSQTVNYQYDGLNRLTKVDHAGTSFDIVYTYDSKQRLDYVTKGVGTSNYSKWDYGYDSYNRMTSEQLLFGSKSWNFGYQFDAYNNVKEVTYPDGSKINYAPDSSGLATKVGDYASSVRYYPSGAVKSYNYGNGLSFSMAQDARQLPSKFTVPGAMDVTYQYDKKLNVSSITDHLNSSNNVSMKYDQFDRLKNVSGASWAAGNVTYDATSNIKTKTTGGLNLTYNYDATNNRLKNVTGSKPYTFTYDHLAAVKTNGQNQTFNYNADGTLNQIVDSAVSSGTQSYVYDAYNRRIKETGSGNNNYFVYNTAGKLMLDEKAGISTNYIYLGNQLLASNKGKAPIQGVRTSKPILCDTAYVHDLSAKKSYPNMYTDIIDILTGKVIGQSSCNADTTIQYIHDWWDTSLYGGILGTTNNYYKIKTGDWVANIGSSKVILNNGSTSLNNITYKKKTLVKKADTGPYVGTRKRECRVYYQVVEKEYNYLGQETESKELHYGYFVANTITWKWYQSKKSCPSSGYNLNLSKITHSSWTSNN